MLEQIQCVSHHQSHLSIHTYHGKKCHAVWNRTTNQEKQKWENHFKVKTCLKIRIRVRAANAKCFSNKVINPSCYVRYVDWQHHHQWMLCAHCLIEAMSSQKSIQRLYLWFGEAPDCGGWESLRCAIFAGLYFVLLLHLFITLPKSCEQASLASFAFNCLVFLLHSWMSSTNRKL